MKRYASLVLLLLTASPAAAQDIALSQILPDGQGGWRRVTKDTQGWLFAEILRTDAPVVVTAANGFRYVIDDSGRKVIATKEDGEKVLTVECTTPGLARLPPHPRG